MTREVPWIAVVSEDGRKLYFDHAREWGAALAEFAGQEVEIVLRPRRRPPTSRQRGFYYAVLVELAIEHDGYETVDAAHSAIVHGVLAPAWAKRRPSTSDRAMSSEEFAEFVERACADFILNRGWIVPDPEPDPVARFEALARPA